MTSDHQQHRRYLIFAIVAVTLVIAPLDHTIVATAPVGTIESSEVW